ncbi:hypothetical protein FACS1894170_03300 [Planctomycetales bacterium]|nr:hypothetical protein FACS1894170_03300 [Planctomycetales bacterium]
MKYSKRAIVIAGLLLTGLVLVFDVRRDDQLHWDVAADKTFVLKLGDEKVKGLTTPF